MAPADWLLGHAIPHLQLDTSQICMEFCIAFESVAQSQNRYLKCYFTVNALREAPVKEKPLALWRNISWKGPLEILLLNVGLTWNLNQVAQGFVGLRKGIRLLSS